MYKKCKVWSCIVACITGLLISGCRYHLADSESVEITSGITTAVESMEITQEDTSEEVSNQMWQDAYAELMQDFFGKDFFLCDIDGNGIPELLIGGFSTDTDKYANYDVYTYKSDIVKELGTVGTLRWSSLWLDGNSGILGYSYGAGGGETYRFYIDNDVLCYDGEVYGYYFESEGNPIEWFRGADGSKIIVTEETKHEYEKIWKDKIDLECYTISEDTILKVIYGGT